MDASLRGRSTVRSYRRFLDDFARLGLVNRLMRDAARNGGFDGSWCIRHDIDYHLGRALLMAEIEKSLGLKSTFYFLPPGHDSHRINYYGRATPSGIIRSDYLGAAARRLTAMGHEVGLHNDFIYLEKITGIPRAELLTDEIRFFESEGVEISGTAAHGSKYSRKLNYVNFEMFAECDRTRAHVYVDREGGGGYQRLIQDGGFSLQLNTVEMAAIGLQYEAYFVGPCLYIMDSGGRLTARWFDGPAPVVQDRDELTHDDLTQLMADSGAPGVQVLVHADHWNFANADAPIAGWRRATAGGEPIRSSTSHILPAEFLVQIISRIRTVRAAAPIHYGGLDLDDDFGTDPGLRLAREEDRFKPPPDRCVVLLQAFAGPDPEAVEVFLSACRSQGLPYTLFTFARWRNPTWGTVEPYPLAWDALAKDVEDGLATVGYLYNAWQLAEGSEDQVYRDFESDVAWLRARGMDCRVMAPFAGPRPQGAPTLDRDRWWDRVAASPLCVTGPFPLAVNAAYNDAPLPRVGRYRGDLNPEAWLSRELMPGRRVTISLHPQYYGQDLTLLDGDEPAWVLKAREQHTHGLAR